MRRLVSSAAWPDRESYLISVLTKFSGGLKYGPTLEELNNEFQTIQLSVILPHLVTLWHCRLWADQLAAPTPVPWIMDYLSQHCPWATVLGADLEDPRTGRWVKIPILTVDDRSTRGARVVCFIAGLVPSNASDLFIPTWARKLMDTRFEKSILTAEQWVRSVGKKGSDQISGRRFVIFPLAVDNGWVQLTGGSAALALALGMKSLAENQPLCPKVIATGCLDGHGGVTPVAYLDQKAGGASEAKFKCLVHPVQTVPRNALEKQMNTYAVSRFDMAWTLASLYSDQHARNLHDFTLALDDARRFIDKMAHFPGPWIEYQKGAVRNLLSDVFKDMALFGCFARAFSDMVRDYSLHDTARCLSESTPDRVPEKWPMAALIWCTANLALANHRGRTTRIETWAHQGKKMADKAMTLDADLAVEFFNSLLVNAHNRFEFSMKLPESLERLLGLLETRRDVMAAASGCTIDQPLGRLYGTLVQNAAFCGPQHIGDTENLSAMARQALGENSALELEPEWMRQYSYLGLARLCAGNIAGALPCLFKYLKVEDEGQIASKVGHLDTWQINMLTRFLATGAVRLTDTVYSGLICHTQKAVNGHPWQLICFNLGRAALSVHSETVHDKKKARALFEQSLGICLGPDSGPTIRIMMLKPLTFLKELVPAGDFSQKTDHWQALAKEAAAQLNPERFAFLYDRSFSSALDHVRRHHDQVFPFSYQ